jgi:hypothetical protein
MKPSPPLRVTEAQPPGRPQRDRRPSAKCQLNNAQAEKLRLDDLITTEASRHKSEERAARDRSKQERAAAKAAQRALDIQTEREQEESAEVARQAMEARLAQERQWDAARRDAARRELERAAAAAACAEAIREAEKLVERMPGRGSGSVRCTLSMLELVKAAARNVLQQRDESWQCVYSPLFVEPVGGELENLAEMARSALVHAWDAALDRCTLRAHRAWGTHTHTLVVLITCCTPAVLPALGSE